MIKRIAFFILIGVSSLVYQGCSSGIKALQRGDYDDAITKSINRLRSDPSNKKALLTIRQAYPLALKYYQNRVDQTLNEGDQFKWGQCVGIFEKVNQLSDEIERCPAALNVIPTPKHYAAELKDAREKAAEERYHAGMAALQLNTRNAAKEAYTHFEAADHYVASYKNSRALMNQALQIATLKIIVEPALVYSQVYKLSAEFFNQKIMEALDRTAEFNKFIRFYTPQEAKQLNIKYPDHVVRLRFQDFVIGNSRLTERSYETQSKDSVVIGEAKTRNGEKVQVLGLVKAEVKVTKLEVSSGGLLEMTIEDYQSNRVLSKNQIPGEYIWNTEWASYNGDKRALTDHELDLVKRRTVSPPLPQDLFIQFTQPIYNQLTQKLRYFYQDY
ncbi:MAG: hypothetical protein Q8859_04580 [Bacteroidota bacterium]|nr:hypothetical protein [Bacteroidota bacterium]